MTQEDKAAQEYEEFCELNVLSQPFPTDGRLYCNRTWDGWGCWNDTLAGTRATTPCPSYVPGFDPSLTAFKDCDLDGSWWHLPGTNRTWSNYTTCINTHDLEVHTRLIYIFIAGYAISMSALLVSLFIFFFFRQLQCDRVTLHKHLFASYILNGFVWILYYTLAALDVEILANNPTWCQVLHVITQYFVACNFFWMFCEGLYLHTIIVVAFTSGRKLLISCVLIGWCFPIFTTLIYAVTREHIEDTEQKERCWIRESSLQWIVLAPIVITIALNFAFLCNIVRVLITKLRAVHSPDTNQTRKAVRATLILIPLLGLQYILLPLRPDKKSNFHDTYIYISALATSCQGFFVALIFCFLNGEVISVLKRKWGQHRLMQGKSTGRTTLYTQSTLAAADTIQTPIAPPKSPCLYDNRCQAPGGKPLKPIANIKPFKIRKSLPTEYVDLEQTNAVEENSTV